jgi:hypothetical protein
MKKTRKRESRLAILESEVVFLRARVNAIAHFLDQVRNQPGQVLHIPSPAERAAGSERTA